MNWLLPFYPGDDAVRFGLAIGAQMTVVLLGAVLVSLPLRRHAAARFTVLAACAVVVVLLPITSWLLKQTDVGWLSFRLAESQASDIQARSLSEVSGASALPAHLAEMAGRVPSQEDVPAPERFVEQAVPADIPPESEERTQPLAAPYDVVDNRSVFQAGIAAALLMWLTGSLYLAIRLGRGVRRQLLFPFSDN